MVKIVADTAMLAKLHNLDTVLEFCDPSGQTLGYFKPSEGVNGDSARVRRSPCSIEELQYLRRQRKGRPLSEIMKELEQS